MVFDEDIILEMRKNVSIDNILMMRYVKILVDNYGIYEEVAKEGVLNWARAFGIEVNLLGNVQKIEEIEINKVVCKEKIEAKEKEYEFVEVQDRIVIKKFIGFDQDEIVIPNEWRGKKIIGIGENAFSGCTGIKKIVVSEGIEYIENGAFYNCTSLNNILLPNTLNYLGKLGTGKDTSSFSDKIKELSLEELHQGAVNFISDVRGTFENTSITTVDIPISVNYIGERCFSNCKHLLEVNVLSEVDKIENGTFKGCTSLKQVKLVNGIHEIGTLAFYGCKSLSDISIPQTVKEIGNYALAYCTKLVNVDLGEGIQKIRWHSFSNCTILKKILVPQSISDIDENAFTIEEWHQPYDKRRNGFHTSRLNKEIVLYCYAGSYGLAYARKLGFKIENAAKA